MRSRHRVGGKRWTAVVAVIGAFALVSCAELAGPAKGRRSHRAAFTRPGASAAVRQRSTARPSRATGASSSFDAARPVASASPARIGASGGVSPSAHEGEPPASPITGRPAGAVLDSAHLGTGLAERTNGLEGEPSAGVALTAAPEPIGPPPPPVPEAVFLGLWKIEDVPSDMQLDFDHTDTPETPPDPEAPEVPPENLGKDSPEYADSLRVDNAPQRGPGGKLLQWVRDKFEQMERAARDPFSSGPVGLDFCCPPRAVIQQRLEAERP